MVFNMDRHRASMLAPLLALVGLAAVQSQTMSRREALSRRKAEALEDSPFSQDLAGELNLTFALTVIGVIIGAVVGISVLSALAPTWFSSITGIVSVFTSGNYTTGDTTADGLMPIFGLVIAFAGLFALVGLVFLVVKLQGKGA